MARPHPFRLLVDAERAAQWLTMGQESSRPLPLAIPAALQRLREECAQDTVADGMLAIDIAYLLGYLAGLGDIATTFSVLDVAPVTLTALIRRFGPSLNHGTLTMAVAVLRHAHASGYDAPRALLHVFGVDRHD